MLQKTLPWWPFITFIKMKWYKFPITGYYNIRFSLQIEYQIDIIAIFTVSVK